MPHMIVYMVFTADRWYNSQAIHSMLLLISIIQIKAVHILHREALSLLKAKVMFIMLQHVQWLFILWYKVDYSYRWTIRFSRML